MIPLKDIDPRKLQVDSLTSERARVGATWHAVVFKGAVDKFWRYVDDSPVR